ncbi:MAG: endonuclease domain-containing protein [Chloroflexota bacterium]|nr:endonuclease domain-containing protein [Chloroflexota bacterium]
MSEKKKWTSTHTDSAIYGDIKSKALAMRKLPTRAEKTLWQCLRGKRMRGFRFRRQQPIDRFIVDFYCRQAQLVVEVDGSSYHSTEAAKYDNQRTQFLNDLGLIVLRFSNEQVIYETDTVLNTIAEHLPSESP